MGRYRTAVDELWPSIPAALRPATVSGVGPGVLPVERAPLLESPPVAGFTSPSRVVDRTMFASRTGDVLFTGPCRLGSPGWASADSLVLWWRATHDVPIDGSATIGDRDFRLNPDHPARAAEAAAFSALPEADRTAWFEANAGAVRGCAAPPLAGG
jgi:hypothetical protein